MRYQAALVAGGAGTRMRGFRDEPKALLPVRGRPLIEHTLELLKNAGFDDLFLCLGHGAQALRERLGDGSRLGLRLDYRVELSPRGTAGAVADLGGAIRHDLLIVYGDLFVAMELKLLLESHAAHDAEATLVIRRTDHPEDSDLVELEPGGRVRRIGRRAAGLAGDLGCAAVWVVRPRLLARVPADRPSDFARDLFPAAVARGERIMGYLTEEPVLDIGTPERYRAFVGSTA